jgi:methionine synthase I (cobalamin-dependent)
MRKTERNPNVEGSRLVIPARGVLLGDGGIGTELQRAGFPTGEPADAASINASDAVACVHAAYAAAGAQWSTTNTFAAGPQRWGARLGEVCRAAVDAARRGAPDLPVLGSVGPLLLQPGVESLYEETVAALVAAGVDGFLVETIVDLRSGEAAVQAAAGAGLVIASFTTGRDGRLLDGREPEHAAAALVRAGASAIGANCGYGPDEMLDVVRRLVAAQEGPVLAAPNAGLPTMIEGRACYNLSADSFARAAIQFSEAGARLIAGCCGTTPEHIRAASSALHLLPGG